MCYDVSYLTKKSKKYASRLSNSKEKEESIELGFNELKNSLSPQFHTNGFIHPSLIVINSFENPHPLLFSWGLIPFWVKDPVSASKLSNNTINARGETIFEKPSFREPAKNKRCIIVIDGFFEHHHFNGKTYPFFITLKNNEPIFLAGLWDKWEYEQEGITKFTVTIVTTKANPLMAKIHNNPKLSEPRMPLMLPNEFIWNWIKPINDELDKKEVQALIQPYDENELIAYTTPKIRGKSAIGNTSKAIEEYKYAELQF